MPEQFSLTRYKAVFPNNILDPAKYLVRESAYSTDELHSSARLINIALKELAAVQTFIGVHPSGNNLLSPTFLFGDGSTGSVTITGTTTLAADVFYDNLTIESSGVLDTAGYRVFVKNNLTIEPGGIIDRSGNPGVDDIAGAALVAGSLGGSGAGGNGGGGDPPVAGTAGSNTTNSLGGSGGAGGASDGAGGAGGTATVAITGARDVITLLRLFNSVGIMTGGAGGGGGGSSTLPLTAGGGGGSGGGIILIAARLITNNGTIRANGGDGGAPGTDAGGAGSGGGGFVGILTDEPVSGSGLIQVDSGTPTGNGVSGVAGTIVTLVV